MIAANDLRIGNRVMYDNRYFQIDSIATVFPTLNTAEFGIGVVDYNNIEPIPLTEKILLDCGFYIDETKNASRMLPNNEVLILELNDKGIYTDYAYGTEIEYLHNLQNLHKELSKTELIINL